MLKYNGLKEGGKMMENTVHLPTNQKFTLSYDEEGVYTLESQQENGPVVDGLDPNEVVARMIEVMPIWNTVGELSRGYIANAAHALKLYKEFEGAVMEVLGRTEPWESEAGK